MGTRSFIRNCAEGFLDERTPSACAYFRSRASGDRCIVCLDSIYVQAKRWQNTVGRPDIQRFAGALQGQRARKGIFITTSIFSAEAIAYASNLNTTIVLIDGRMLTELMMDAQIGVSSSSEIRILKPDEDYFDALEAI